VGPVAVQLSDAIIGGDLADDPVSLDSDATVEQLVDRLVRDGTIRIPADRRYVPGSAAALISGVDRVNRLASSDRLAAAHIADGDRVAVLYDTAVASPGPTQLLAPAHDNQRAALELAVRDAESGEQLSGEGEWILASPDLTAQKLARELLNSIYGLSLPEPVEQAEVSDWTAWFPGQLGRPGRRVRLSLVRQARILPFGSTLLQAGVVDRDELELSYEDWGTGSAIDAPAAAAPVDDAPHDVAPGPTANVAADPSSDVAVTVRSADGTSIAEAEIALDLTIQEIVDQLADQGLANRRDLLRLERSGRLLGHNERLAGAGITNGDVLVIVSDGHL
jgi:uncharacterized ubiquitin-like protein YukD